MIDFGEHVSERSLLDLTPMIDVVFLLLVFFLLTSTSARTYLPLDLPQAAAARDASEPGITVVVSRDGALLLDGHPVTLDALSGALARRFGAGGARVLGLASDEGVPFGRVVEVMDVATRAGARHVSVETERRRP
jgi:biopolymer transport protein ExbD